jgi:bis(5'-nucleosyl)-tetraphosphatase (symmetrical)
MPGCCRNGQRQPRGRWRQRSRLSLQGPSCDEFLANLWGSEPLCWSDDLQGWSRLRVIVNAMTRMRFCSLSGTMDLKTKGEAADAPAGHLPWFDIPGRRSADAVLIIGHWSALGLRIEDKLLALDSGCFWGRHLSAVRLEDRAVFQVDCSSSESQV